jgi:hypothetical protein
LWKLLDKSELPNDGPDGKAGGKALSEEEEWYMGPKFYEDPVMLMMMIRYWTKQAKIIRLVVASCLDCFH